nr:FAD-dependent oxidoreductase [uncultured Oscillibacter sp.]
MNDDLKNLFTPFNIGNVKVKNRFCMGPMGIAHIQGPNHEFGQAVLDYFGERAKGGFGLITVGVQVTDTKVDPFDPKTTKSPLYNPSVFRKYADRLVERCDAYNTRLFCQVSMGFGRNAPGYLAPSVLPDYHNPDTLCQALTKDQIKQKVEQMVEGAALMKASGIQGVELHAMHWGYLLDQFAMSLTNHREDEYGGSLDNRLRVCKEIIDGIHQVCGENYPVTMRLGLKSYMKGFNKASLTGEEEVGRTLEEGIEICKKLEAMGFAALSVDTGTYDSFYYACPPSYLPRGHALDLYAKAKEAVSIPILAGSRMGDPYLCAQALKEGKADAFVLSRPSLADPDFPKKVEMGMPEKIRPCIGCNAGCVGRLLDKGLGATCAVNPRAMRESEFSMRKPVEPKKIMVVGGGVAGMEAARMAAEMGHTVVLYEKSDVLGGELLAAGNRPLKTEVAELNEWYQRELKDLDVPIIMNTTVTADTVKAVRPDVAILALGASSVMPRSIPGIDHAKSVSAIDALTGKKPVGDTVVVVGGGEIGCETAMHFVMQGKKVSLVEALPDIMSVEFVPNQHKNMLKDMLEYHKVPVYTGHRLLSINDEGAVIAASNGSETLLKADTVVVSIGMRSNPSFASELSGTGINVYEIGSGKRVGNIYNAVHDAFEIIYNL